MPLHEQEHPQKKLTPIDNTADRLSASNSFATESTANFKYNKTLSNAGLYLSITSTRPRASSSSSTELQSRCYTASSISDRPNVIMAYPEHKREDIHEMLHGLVAKKLQDNIYTCDVTELAFRRSPMADGATTRVHCNTDTRMHENEHWIANLSHCFMMFGISQHGLCPGRGSRNSSSLVKHRRGGFKPEGSFEFG